MLRPSKLTPSTNAVLASMFSELFPEEQVAIVRGVARIGVTDPFAQLPDMMRCALAVESTLSASSSTKESRSDP